MPKVIVYSIVIIRWTKLYDFKCYTLYRKCIILIVFVGT